MDVREVETERDGRYAALLQHSSDLTLVLSPDEFEVTYASTASSLLLGLEPHDLVGMTIADFVQTEDLIRMLTEAVFDEGSEVFTVTIESRWIHADGSWRDIEAIYTDLRYAPGIGGYVVNARDVTSRNQLQRELRRSQKLESVGQLASGIAHEINTPVQFVGDNFRFLEESFETAFALIEAYRDALSPDRPPLSWEERCALVDTAERVAEVDYLRQEVPCALKEAREGIDRIATIVRAMRSFGHPDGAEQSPTDLNECLRDTLTVARNELKYVARVETDFGELPAVSCYRSDVNQVFLNLLINAAHAVADAHGPNDLGTITVRTRREDCSVVVSVTDNGAGIDDSIRDRVFDPFFTTKEVGRGTGQGLALSRSVVVERHRGSLTFDSLPGVGTTFIVRLPIVGVRGVRVLFVDDDPSVLGGLRRMLRGQRHRFETVCASSGAEALRFMDNADFDVIVTDMRMPEMDGSELLEIVRERHADVVRIVLSGQLDDSTAVRLAVLVHQFLSKPCEFDALVDAIERSCGIRTRLLDPELRQALGRLDALPSPRPTLQRLTDSLRCGDASLSDVTGLIRDDPAITAKLLQLVNSAFFGLPRHVGDVRDAVVYLGLGMIRDLVAAADVFHAFEDDRRIDRTTYKQIRSDCVRSAEVAAQLSGQMADACVAAMLHDVGLLALAVCLPRELAEITATAHAAKRPLHEVELEVIGASHADIGAYLLTLWGFRDDVLEAVAYHHTAPEHSSDAPLTHITFVATALANRHEQAEGLPSLELPVALDPEYLARVNLGMIVGVR